MSWRWTIQRERRGVIQQTYMVTFSCLEHVEMLIMAQGQEDYIMMIFQHMSKAPRPTGFKHKAITCITTAFSILYNSILFCVSHNKYGFIFINKLKQKKQLQRKNAGEMKYLAEICAHIQTKLKVASFNLICFYFIFLHLF